MSISLAIATVVAAAPALIPDPPQSPAELFPLPIHPPNGVSMRSGVARDFDGDGRIDFAIAAEGSDGNKVRVLYGQADGGLAGSAEYPVGWQAFAVDSADFDRDGRLDLAAVCLNFLTPSHIDILLGRGAGTFHQALEFDVDARPMALALGDIDEDGNIDVLVNDALYLSSHGVRWLRGRGDGTFDPAVALPINEQVRSPQLVDLDGDGHLDLAGIVLNFATNQYSLQPYAGHGDGTFSIAAPTAIVGLSHHVRFHDFDGDGALDAIVSAGSHAMLGPIGSVQLLRGLAGFAFAPPVILWSGAPAGASELTDVDGDGRVDVIVPHEYGAVLTAGLTGGFAIARGLGGLAFAAAEEFRTGTNLGACHSGDIDGDGLVDLITLGPIGVVHAVAPGEFDTGLEPIALAGPGRVVASGDIDGDGRTDLASLAGARHIELRRNLGQPRFSDPRTLDAATRVEGVALRDFNGDGRDDVVAVGPRGWVGSGQSGTLSIWSSTSNGFDVRRDFDIGEGNHAIAIADFDGDGLADPAISCGSVVHVFHSFGDGSFAPLSDVHMDPLLEGYGRATLLTGDFDGDGRADIAQTPEDRVIVAYGLGLGAFTAPVKIESGYVFALYAAADLDLDGIDDLLFGEFGPAWWQPWVTMGLYGNSNRTLDSRRLSIQQTFSDVVVADFDGDGKPDLAGVGNYELSILTGNGRRDFVPQLDYAMGYAAHIAPGDFNGDGRVDIACAFEHEPILSILLRR